MNVLVGLLCIVDPPKSNRPHKWKKLEFNQNDGLGGTSKTKQISGALTIIMHDIKRSSYLRDTVPPEMSNHNHKNQKRKLLQHGKGSS